MLLIITHGGTVAAELARRSPIDKDSDVARRTGSVRAGTRAAAAAARTPARAGTGAARGRGERRDDGETQVDVAARRYTNRPATRERRRDAGRVVGAGERAVDVVQRAAATCDNTNVDSGLRSLPGAAPGGSFGGQSLNDVNASPNYLAGVTATCHSPHLRNNLQQHFAHCPVLPLVGHLEA